MARIRLTKRFIDALPPSKKKTYDMVFDTEVTGFGIKVFPSARKYSSSNTVPVASAVG